MVLMQVKAATARQVAAAAAAKAPAAAAAAAAIIRKLSISRHRNHKWQPIMKASPRSSIRSSLGSSPQANAQEQSKPQDQNPLKPSRSSSSSISRNHQGPFG